MSSLQGHYKGRRLQGFGSCDILLLGHPTGSALWVQLYEPGQALVLGKIHTQIFKFALLNWQLALHRNHCCISGMDNSAGLGGRNLPYNFIHFLLERSKSRVQASTVADGLIATCISWGALTWHPEA